MKGRDDQTLLEAMDAAAHELLKHINPDVETLDPNERLMQPTLPEKVKMFATLADYVKWREHPTGSSAQDGSPPKSKFQLLKGEFNNGRGNKAKGGGNKRDSAAAPAPATDNTDDDDV